MVVGGTYNDALLLLYLLLLTTTTTVVELKSFGACARKRRTRNAFGITVEKKILEALLACKSDGNA